MKTFKKTDSRKASEISNCVEAVKHHFLFFTPSTIMLVNDPEGDPRCFPPTQSQRLRSLAEPVIRFIRISMISLEQLHLAGATIAS